MASQAIAPEEEDRNRSAALADIGQLCVEFQRAIAALTANNIADLESSTAVQEDLVEKLDARFRGKRFGQPSSIRVSPSDLKYLVKLTRIYSSLLQRALRTTRLRAALCQTYRQNFPAQSEPAVASGWSCEV